MVSLGTYAAWVVFGVTLLLAGCGGGGGGESSEQPGTAVPKGLHITGVDDAGARVDMWVQPFQAPATLRLSATDNDAVTGIWAYSADSGLDAFLGGGGPVTYGFLSFGVAGEEGPGLWCFAGCSLDLRFDASSRKLNIQFPDEYRFLRNISEASVLAGGDVRVAGSVTFDYDPEWLVLRPKRFPETPVGGTILVEGEPFGVVRLAGRGLREGGVFFVAADGSAVSLSLIADGSTLQLLYQDVSTSRTWRTEIPASVMERTGGDYQLRLDEQILDSLSPDGPATTVISLDVTMREADGTIAVAGMAGTSVLYPTTYSLTTTNNVREYMFAMVNQDGSRFWLTVGELGGDIQSVRLESETADVLACGVSPWPACAGIGLSDDGYVFDFAAAALGDEVRLSGSVMHAGVRTWAASL